MNSLRDPFLRQETFAGAITVRQDALEASELSKESKQRSKIDQYLLHTVEEQLSKNTNKYILGRHGKAVYCIALSPDGAFLASGSSNEGSVKIWNLIEIREEFVLVGHYKGVRALAYTPNGEYLFSGSEDSMIKMWNIMKKQIERTIELHIDEVTSITISPKGTELISGSKDKNIKCWNIYSRTMMELDIDQEDSPIICILYSPNGKLVAISYENNCVLIHNLKNSSNFTITSDYKTTALVFTTDSKVIITGSESGAIEFWDIKKETRKKIIDRHSSQITSLALTQDGKNLSCSFVNGLIETFDMLYYSFKSSITNHNGKVNCILYTNDKEHLITGADDRLIRVFNLKEKSDGEVFVYHSEDVRAVSISSSGRFLVSVSSKFVEQDSNREKKGHIVVWDLKNNEMFREKIIENPNPSCLAISPFEEFIAIELNPNQVYLWEFQDDLYSREIGWHLLAVSAFSFSINGEFLASGSNDRDVLLFNLYDEQKNFLFTGHENQVTSLSFCPKTRYVASGSYDKTVKVWDIENHEIRCTFSGHTLLIRAVIFSKSGEYIYSASQDKTIRVFNLNRNKEEKCLTGHKQAVFSLAISSNDHYLFSASEDSSIKVWNLKDYSEEFSLTGHSSTVNSLSLSSDDKCLASSSNDKTVRIWNIQEKQSKKMVLAYPLDLLEKNSPNLILETEADKDEIMILGRSEDRAFRTLAYSSNGKLLAMGDNDGFVQIWNMVTDQLQLMIKSHAGEVRSLCFSPDSSLLITVSSDRRVRLWDVNVGKNVFAQFEHLEAVRCVTISPSSELIATGSEDRTVKLWNIRNRMTLREEFTFMGHYATVSCVVFDITGKVLASGSYDFTIKVWSVVKREELFTLTGHTNYINSITFSPDCKILASGSNDGSIKIWNVKEQREDFNLCTVDSSINSLTYSNDGNFLVAGCGKGCIKILNVKQRQEEYTLKGHEKWVYCVIFTPDGKKLVSSSKDGTVRFWQLKKNNKNILSDTLNRIDSLILSPRLTHAAVVISENLTEIWNLVNNERISSVNDFNSSEKTILFSENGSVLALRSQQTEIVLCSFDSGNSLRTLTGNEADIIFLTISKDSSCMASCSLNCKVAIWNLNHLDNVKILDLGSHPPTSLRFTQRNDSIIYSLKDLSIRSLNLWSEASTLLLKNEKVEILEVSQDLKYILILSEYHYVKVFEKDSRAEIFTYHAKVSNIISMCFSNNSRYFALQTLSGFILLDIKTKKRISKFKIKKLEKFSITLKIKSLEIIFNFQMPLTINPVLQHVADYQENFGFEFSLSSKMIDTNSNYYSPSCTLDHYFQNYFTFRGTVSCLDKNHSKKFLPRHSGILVSEFKYTILHFASFKGDQAALKNCMTPDSRIVVKTDVFGKSPLYYSITKKHQKCVHILMNYLIELKIENKEIMINSLNSTRNDFTLIIQNSSKQLPAYLNKIILDFEVVSCPATKKMPMFMLSECFIPKVQDFGVKTKRSEIPAVLQQTAFQLPIQPYSKENFVMLERILRCYNSKIFENVLVKYIVDYNWQAVYPWAVSYSLVVFSNILTFVLASYIDKSVFYNFIPFIVTTSLLLLWEIVQLISNGKSYFTQNLNFIDMFSICLSAYWVVAVQVNFNSYYEEFLLAFLLFFRGLTCFRVIRGVRYYINLVLSSVSSIKYFILLFFYSTFFFAILFHIGAIKESGLSLLVEKSWRLNFTGEAELAGNETLLYFSVFLATIVNQILMLNMLISILGDSYDQFMIDKNVIDYKEKIDIVMEVQNVVNCKRVLRNQKKYFHTLTSPIQDFDINKNDWEGRINYLINKQEKRIEEILSKMKKTEERITISIKNSEERINQNEGEARYEIKGSIGKTDQKIENLQGNFKFIVNTLEGLQGQLIGIHHNEDHNQDLTYHRESIDSFRDHFNQLNKNDQHFQKGLNEIMEKYLLIEGILPSVIEKFDAIDRLLREYGGNIDTLNGKFSEIQSKVETFQGGINLINEVREKVGSFEANFREMTEKVCNFEDNFKDIKDKAYSLENSFKSIDEKVDSLGQRFNDFDGKVEEKLSQIVDSRIAGVERKIGSIEGVLSEILQNLKDRKEN